MADLKPLAENGVDPKRVAAGEVDVIEPPTARNAAMFNRCMLLNARKEIYYHPDDANLLPDPLPEARNGEISTSGADEMFTALQQRHLRRG